MEKLDIYVLNDYPLYNDAYLAYDGNYIIMSTDDYNYLLSYINTNFLIVFFMLSCFSTLICCTYREKNQNYINLETQETIPAKIVEIPSDKC